MDGEQQGTGASTPAFVDPFEDTAPQPVIHAHLATPHHHEGTPGPEQSPPGHHVAAPGHPVPGRHEDRGRRTTLVVAAAAVAALALLAAVGWALAGRGPTTAAEPAGGSSTAPATTAVTPTGSAPLGAAPSAAMLPASQPTLVLGDSLGLIAYPYLADLVPDRYVSYEAEVGRSTAGTAKALAKLGSVPPVVIVSSGTNDGTAAELTSGATEILDELGPQRCVVWVDVARPDRIGDSQGDMNAALDAVVAGRANVTVLRWSAMVAEHPEWLAGDGIHPTQDGAKARAQAYADASAACSPVDPSAPRAKRQYLPDSVFWGPVSGSGQQQGSSGGSSSSSPSRTATPSTSASASPSGTSTPSPTKTSEKPTPSPTPTPSASTAASAASSAPPAA